MNDYLKANRRGIWSIPGYEFHEEVVLEGCRLGWEKDFVVEALNRATRQIDDVKTDKGNRNIALDSDTVKVLRELKWEQAITVTLNKYSYVLPGLQEAAAASCEGLLDGLDGKMDGKRAK